MLKNLFFTLCVIYYAGICPLEAEYQRPQNVDKETWKEVKPYFLPHDHPLKNSLDEIFYQKKRVLLSKKSMKKAGFLNSEPEETTRIVVSKHPKIPGYIIKTHLDAQKARKNLPEQYYWMLRIEGARKIHQLIAENGWEEAFKVPKKWIYPLPSHPAPPKAFQRINFILVEEDMNLVDAKQNKKIWGSPFVDKPLLEKIFYITETLGLNDCAKPDNIPFSQDGKIAFIDTQSHEEWPVLFDKLTSYLSPEMKTFWKTLTKKHRK